MKNKQYRAKLEKEIEEQKNIMIKRFENEIKSLMLGYENLKNADATGDIINFARVLKHYAESMEKTVSSQWEIINEARLGLFFLQEIED